MIFDGEMPESASSENVVFDLDLESHDLENVIIVTWIW